MRPFLAISILATLLAVVSPPLKAELCSVDAEPGATLLLPYFEVDLADPDGITTVMSIHNSASETVLARVVAWTDLGYPTLGFEIYLTGFDVQAINLREIFAGRLPQTGPELSPTGRLSGPEVDFPSCDFGGEPPVPIEALLADAHIGQPSPFLEGLCAGRDHGDQIARGYVTVDVVSDCSPLFPSDPGYFGPEGVARAENVLLGDFLLFDAAGNRAFGDNLLSLEADPDAFEPGALTFYGRYVDFAASDGREPLPNLWSNRYLLGGGLDLSARTLAWRDTGEMPALFDCNAAGPEWFPLGFTEILSFDEQENAVFYTTDVVFIRPPDPPFPGATQAEPGHRGFAFGWEILDLDPSPERRSQSYVLEQVTAGGGASFVRPAMPLENACGVGGCAFEAPPIGEVCVAGIDGGDLEAGSPISVSVRPEGCFSSTCTDVLRARCELDLRSNTTGLITVSIETNFCLRTIDDGGSCSADCDGAGAARCDSALVPEGDYVLRTGDLELAFSVPMEVPEGGLCVGDPFEP